MNRKLMVIFIMTLFAAKTTAYNLYKFDMGTNLVIVSDLINGEKKDQYKIDWKDIMNPKMIVSHNGAVISLSSYGTSEQWLLERKSRKTLYSEGISSQYQYDKKNSFYVKSLGKGEFVLVHLTNNKETEIYRFKGNSYKQPLANSNGIISWFFRSDGVLFTFDINSQQGKVQHISCQQAMKLEENYLCITEKDRVQIVDKNQNIIREIYKFNKLIRLITYKPQNDEIILTKPSLSFRLSDFLREYHDIYSLNLKTKELKLLKPKAIGWGASFFVN